jgi:hypothetical protein
VPTRNSCRHGDRKDGPKVPLGWQRRHGGRTPPSKFESTEEDEVEGEEGALHSLPREAPPSLEDFFHRQAGVIVGMTRSKWT